MVEKLYTTILLFAAIFSLLLVFAPPSRAYDFPSGKSYATGKAPVQLTTADFNKDGRPDLAVANSGEKTVSIFLARPNPLGGWSLIRAADCPAPDFALAAVSADFDHDGVPDLAVGTRYLGVWVMPGNGDGTFRDAVCVSGPMEARHLAAADFNGDGMPDIAAVDYSSGNVRVLMNRGGLVFDSPSSSSGDGTPLDPNPGPIWLAAADFDLDGLLDIAVADHDAGGVSVYRGDGSGGLALTVFLPTGAGPRCVGAMDLDGDGKPDIAVACEDSSTVSVFMGNGDGTFGARQDITCLNPSGLVLADFDQDGRPDMAVTSGQMNTVSVMMGKGGGSFKPADLYATGAWPQSVACADFNGDGQADLAVVDRVGGSLDVLFGYELKYSLKAAHSPSEGGSVDNPGGVYVAGSTVDLMATPAPGWSFAGWDGPVTDPASPGTQVTMTEDVEVLARFVRDGGALTMSRAGDYVTLTASYFSMGTPVGNGTPLRFYARLSTDGGQTWSKWASKGKGKTNGGVAVSKPIRLKKQGSWQFKASYTPKKALPIPTNSLECESAGTQ